MISYPNFDVPLNEIKLPLSGLRAYIDRSNEPLVLTSRIIPLNDRNVLLSKQWKPLNDLYIETAHVGAYVRAIGITTSFILHYDPSSLVAASVSSIDYPVVAWRIDEAAWQSAQLTSGGGSITLATGLGYVPHKIEVVLAASQGNNDRWKDPDEVLRLTGLEITGTLRPDAAKKKTMLWISDSIGEAVNSLGAHTPVRVSDQNGVLAYTYLLKDLLGVELTNRSFGGMGWAKSVISNAPSFSAFWRYLDAQHSLLDAGGRFLEQFDFICIQLGTNDTSGANITATVAAELPAIRKAAPKAKIVLISPFNGTFYSDILAGTAGIFDNHIHMVDGTMSLSTTDGTHLDIPAHATAASNFVTLLSPIINADYFDNLALSGAGATASASSTFAGLPASNIINGDRTGRLGGVAAYWSTATASAAGATAEVDFPVPTAINRIVPVFLQDNITTNPLEPTETMTFTQYGGVDFEIQYWNGSAWVTVTGGNVTGNTLIMPIFDFPDVAVSKIRLLYHTVGPGSGYANLVALEAYHLINPFNVPRSYVPTLTNVTLGTGGKVTGKYVEQDGKRVKGRVTIVLGTGGSLSGFAQFSLPKPSTNYPGTATTQPLGLAELFDSGVAQYAGRVVWASSTTAGIGAEDTSGTYGKVVATGVSVPFTWGAGDEISCEFCYESGQWC